MTHYPSIRIKPGCWYDEVTGETQLTRVFQKGYFRGQEGGFFQDHVVHIWPFAAKEFYFTTVEATQVFVKALEKNDLLFNCFSSKLSKIELEFRYCEFSEYDNAKNITVYDEKQITKICSTAKRLCAVLSKETPWIHADEKMMLTSTDIVEVCKQFIVDTDKKTKVEQAKLDKLITKGKASGKEVYVYSVIYGRGDEDVIKDSKYKLSELFNNDDDNFTGEYEAALSFVRTGKIGVMHEVTDFVTIIAKTREQAIARYNREMNTAAEMFG